MTTGLRRFAVAPRPAAAAAAERCELCGEPLPDRGGHSPGRNDSPEQHHSSERHAHLVDTHVRSIVCACTACALLFTREGGRYRTVPDRVRHDPEAPLTRAEWNGLGIPVGMAFFMVNSALGRVVASYPSAAGATECELDLAAWDRLAADHPLLREPEPDVEAILVTAGEVYAGEVSAGDGGVEAFLLPVDACYSLAGALRLNWRGFDGGTEVRRVLADFLDGIRDRSRPIAPGMLGTGGGQAEEPGNVRGNDA